MQKKMKVHTLCNRDTLKFRKNSNRSRTM